MSPDDFDHAWRGFVSEAIEAVRGEWRATRAPVSWLREPAGSVVTDLDIRIDVALRCAFTGWFAHSRCLSEELGLMGGGDQPSDYLGVIDPVDGTESLIAGRPDWWVSFGVLRSGGAVAGLLVQPERGIWYDAATVSTTIGTPTGLLGLSPDFLSVAEETTNAIISMPHSANKVVAVLEGRCDAAAFVPTPKSPRWRSWDLAGASAVARKAGVILRMVDGGDLTFDDLAHDEDRSWVCARDEAAFAAAETIVRRLTARD